MATLPLDGRAAAKPPFAAKLPAARKHWPNQIEQCPMVLCWVVILVEALLKQTGVRVGPPQTDWGQSWGYSSVCQKVLLSVLVSSCFCIRLSWRRSVWNCG